jgi:hypothetical protein
MLLRSRMVMAILYLAGMGMAIPMSGQDFRVDTELFDGEEKAPFLETLTIFASGIVYDFRWTEPKEVTVFDPLHGKFTLLDETRRVKATIMTQELLDFTIALEKQAVQQKGLYSFCAAPEFQTSETPIQENGQEFVELRLSAKPITYVAKGQKAQHAEAARAYRQFTDWCARLNATRPGNLPPAARLVLNQNLAEKELLPLEITRTIPLGTKSSVVRSKHLVNWKLSGEDEKRIERAGDWMAKFEAVSYDKYRGEPEGKGNKQVRR